MPGKRDLKKGLFWLMVLGDTGIVEEARVAGHPFLITVRKTGMNAGAQATFFLFLYFVHVMVPATLTVSPPSSVNPL